MSFARHGVWKRCTPLDGLTLILAAASHDVHHPGFTNSFLVATNHDLAIKYNDIAVCQRCSALRLLQVHTKRRGSPSQVLENFHAAAAFEIMLKPDVNLLESFSVAEKVPAALVMAS